MLNSEPPDRFRLQSGHLLVGTRRQICPLSVVRRLAAKIRSEPVANAAEKISGATSHLIRVETDIPVEVPEPFALDGSFDINFVRPQIQNKLSEQISRFVF